MAAFAAAAVFVVVMDGGGLFPGAAVDTAPVVMAARPGGALGRTVLAEAFVHQAFAAHNAGGCGAGDPSDAAPERAQREPAGPAGVPRNGTPSCGDPAPRRG